MHPVSVLIKTAGNQVVNTSEHPSLNQALVESRATAGALFLDEKNPLWCYYFGKLWNEKKKTWTNHYVRMAGTHFCTLAQLFGRYSIGVVKLKLTEEETLEFGFRCSVRELKTMEISVGEYYEKLTLAWDKEIEKRQHESVG